jgi:hypothetical protein
VALWSGGCRGQSGDLVPGGESSGHLVAILGCGESVAAGPEVRGYSAEHRQEPLRATGGGELLHRPFSLPRGLVGVLRSVVQIFGSTMLHAGYQPSVGHTVALSGHPAV